MTSVAVREGAGVGVLLGVVLVTLLAEGLDRLAVVLGGLAVVLEGGAAMAHPARDADSVSAMSVRGKRTMCQFMRGPCLWVTTPTGRWWH
jgi:hypothetical protein